MNIKAVYFIGAGGIGMSAITRYFIHCGLVVAGYDKTPTPLTRQLEKEGMSLHYEEDVAAIPEACRDADRCLVIYTPPYLPTTRSWYGSANMDSTSRSGRKCWER